MSLFSVVVNLILNKSAKLTQNTPVVFVVNSMVMTTFLGAGYSSWRADTANSVFGQFKGRNLGSLIHFFVRCGCQLKPNFIKVTYEKQFVVIPG